MKAGNISSCKTRRGNSQFKLIKCLEMQRQAGFFFFFSLKQMKKGVHYMSHTQSLLLVLTLQAPAWERSSTFFLSFFPLFSSVHTFVRPTSRPLVNQLSVRSLGTTRKSLHFSKAQILIPSHSGVFFFSSVASADLCFSLKSLSIKKKKIHDAGRCHRNS